MIREIQTIRQVIVQTENESEVEYIRSPYDIAKFAQPLIGDLDREVLLAVLLNTKSRIIGIEKVSVGTLSSSLVHPREVMKGLIINNCASFALVHQHPSNICEPSPDDIAVTARMKEVGEIIGIPLLDHVIVGYEKGNYISLKQQGYC
ncbi:DNA repair protein RadC [Exiguobacterium sp. SH5S4]|nr:DNA repair protein RadC [Exiguobacterium sp. SH5S4]